MIIRKDVFNPQQTLHFTNQNTGNIYTLTRGESRTTPQYTIRRYTRQGSGYGIACNATALEYALIEMFISSNCKAETIGANNTVTSIGERPETELPTEGWKIMEEGRDAKGDYAINYVNEGAKLKACFYVQHLPQGRKVSFLLGKHFPISTTEVHRPSAEYLAVIQLAKEWLASDDDLVHIYAFYPNKTLDDLVEEDAR